ncbi:hypothetical protein [Candidatus Marithrix sp. Canyon 246]|uniref:hypothetical protein n=1 Tax=Candidatus Marithrix sp. Canyon 246 TaxID=1827136 RepID=UPI00114CEC01|nr:hypothetical protein [Candidatus Marithrix sp. Canyon 246]
MELPDNLFNIISELFKPVSIILIERPLRLLSSSVTATVLPSVFVCNGVILATLTEKVISENKIPSVILT